MCRFYTSPSGGYIRVCFKNHKLHGRHMTPTEANIRKLSPSCQAQVRGQLAEINKKLVEEAAKIAGEDNQ